MSETPYINARTLVTDTIKTGNISVNFDLLDQWLYLRPSVSNASTIVAGMGRMANTYGRSNYGIMNIVSTQTFCYANSYGTMTSSAIYGTTYMGGGYVLQVDGNGPGVCALFSAKENTITNYSVAGTGGNGTHCGCLLPDGRAIILPLGTGNPNYQIWDNSTRTSINNALPNNIRSSGQGSCIMADGNLFMPASTGNLCVMNTSTFVWSNVLNYGTNDFGSGCVLDVTGNVIIAPSGTSGVGVYNPVTNILTRVTPSGATPGGCWGAANAGDGRVVFGPFNQGTNLFVYNPFTLACTTVPYTWTGSGILFGTVKACRTAKYCWCRGAGAQVILEYLIHTQTA